MADKIYRIEFTDNNGYDIRVDMIPARITDFTSSDVVNLYEGILNKLEIDFEYNTYRHGLHKQHKALLTLNVLHMAPEFWEELQDSIIIDDDVTFAEINYGIIWKIYVKYSATYDLKWVGIQNTTFEESYNPSDQTYEIGMIDAASHCLQQISTEYVRDYYKSSSFEEHQWYYDLYVSSSQWLRQVKTKADEDGTASEKVKIGENLTEVANFWFLTEQNFRNGINSMVSAVMAKMLRGTNANSFEIEYGVNPVFYRQVYDGSGDRGTALAVASTYILAYISDDDNADRDSSTNYQGGYLYFIAEKYDNLFEYLQDFYEGNSKTAFYEPVSNTLEIFDLLEDNELLEIENDDTGLGQIEVDKFNRRYEFIQKARAIYVEAKGNDVSRVEQKLAKSRNGNVVEINILHNNTPTINNDITYISYQATGTEPHETGYYYLYNSQMYRVHELPLYGYDTTDDSDAIIGGAFSIENDGNKRAQSLNASQIQTQSGAAYVSAKVALAFYSSIQQSLFAGKVSHSIFGANIWTPCEGYYVFNPNNLAVDNLPDMYDDYTTHKQKFYITKQKIDLLAGTIEFEMMNRTYED